MTVICPTPGMDIRRLRRPNSATRRSSSGSTPASPVSATTMISPVTDTMGAISVSTPCGRDSRTAAKRSETIWRARYTSVSQSKSTQTKESPVPEEELTCVTPAVPLMADSSGMEMYCSTSSAESPAASVWMVTRGTFSSGNTSTGSVDTAHRLSSASSAALSNTVRRWRRQKTTKAFMVSVLPRGTYHRRGNAPPLSWACRPPADST